MRSLLNRELEYLEERHVQDTAFYYKGSEYAPAFGMIGTLIGLINLWPTLRTRLPLLKYGGSSCYYFYGVILANLIFKPIANKLKARHEEEYLCK